MICRGMLDTTRIDRIAQTYLYDRGNKDYIYSDQLRRLAREEGIILEDLRHEEIALRVRMPGSSTYGPFYDINGIQVFTNDKTLLFAGVTGYSS